MSASTLLCIHRNPAQLSLLRENGYKLLTATNGNEGLRLFAAQSVDAIVLEYHLDVLGGGIVAAEIKKLNPQVPIVMLADDLELPYDALNSVDALVTKSDGSHFLWATVHFVLNVKPARSREVRLRTQMPSPRRRRGRSTAEAHYMHSEAASDPKHTPFSAKEWRSIRKGSVQF